MVEEGIIEIVGGGWVQHDESLTSYKMQVLQVETGREWLKNNFKFMKENLEHYVKVFW